MFFHTPQIDMDLLVFINQTLHTPALNWLMVLVSSKVALFAAFSGAAVWCVRRYGKRQLVLFAVVLAAMGLTDLTTSVVKDEVLRVRPLNAIPSTWYVEDGEWRRRPETFVRTKAQGSSYPSAHAANTACLAVLAGLLWPGLGRKALALPLVVGFSRVYLGKHYPTDVVAGWLFGAVVAGLVWLAWRLWLRDRLIRR